MASSLIPVICPCCGLEHNLHEPLPADRRCDECLLKRVPLPPEEKEEDWDWTEEDERQQGGLDYYRWA